VDFSEYFSLKYYVNVNAIIGKNLAIAKRKLRHFTATNRKTFMRMGNEKMCSNKWSADIFSSRERDILSCITNGHSYKASSILSISDRTANAHIRNIYLKIDTTSKEQIIKFLKRTGQLDAIRNGSFNLENHQISEQYLLDVSDAQTKNIFSDAQKTRDYPR
jgi:DNA-binding CsgD family transcriptional regulator